MGPDKGRIEAIRKSKRRNRIAVTVGGMATAVATFALFLLPTVIPLEQVKMAVFETTNEWIFGNPFGNLWLLGPTVGGLVAGYLAVDRNYRHTWMASTKNGVVATIVGVGFVYASYAGFVAVRYASAILVDPAIGFTVAHVLDVLLVPMVVVLPLLPAALFEGLFSGILGNGLHLVGPRWPDRSG